MKIRFAAMLFALATGCVATAGGYVSTPQPVVTATVDVGTPPPVEGDPAPVADVDPPDDNQYDDDLYEGDAETVELNSNVRVVYGADDAIFYSDGYYWRYGDDGTWYRSTVHTGGWGVYTDIPVHIRTIERPVQYRRYRPATYTPRARKAGPRPAKSRPSYARPARNNNRPGNYNKAQPAKRNDNRPGNYNKAQPQPHNKAQPARNDNRPSNYNKAQPKKAEPAPKKSPPPKKDDDYKKKKK